MTTAKKDNTQKTRNKFPKGNQYGNRNGRPPKEYAWTDLMREAGSLKGKDKKTRREEIIELLYQKAQNGEMDAIKLIMSYEQGKPIETIRTQEIKEEPIQIIRRK